MKSMVLGLGEVLWDMLPKGRQMGGAPANFACQARALGADVNLISRVGRDELGEEIIQSLRDAGVCVKTVGVDKRLPTGTVSVELAVDGQPRYTIHDNVAWDHIDAGEAALQAAEKCDAICFGTLAQRGDVSRSAMMSILDRAPAGALRVLDVNLRPPYIDRGVIEESLTRANALKLNDHELPVLAKMFALASQTPKGQLGELGERFALRLIALTRGAAGSMLWSPDQIAEHDGVKVNVVDTVGAGDAFTAAMTLGVLRGWTIRQINDFAAEFAAFACTHPGATTTLDRYEEFRNKIP